MGIGGRRASLFVCVAIGAVLAISSPAMAVFVPGPAAGLRGSPTDTELVMTGTGPGQGVSGFIANSDNPFDPVANAYPGTNPTSGFRTLNEGFAGIIHATPKSGGAPLQMYCIDILTSTYGGIGYSLGDWADANVPRVGYVARIMNEYYPNTNEPTSLGSPSEKAAAVQAAIWYLSDRYVLSTSDPLRATVATIVASVVAAGPLVQPPPPSLSLAPTTASGPQGSVIGPFTLTSSSGPAAVTSTGATMFSDAAGTTPIADGTPVASGAPIWLKSTGPASAVLKATAQATVPTGNVYLYDGNAPGVTDAQKLILAQTGTLTTTVSATAQFEPPGSLVVNKTIEGAAAGQQAGIVITVVCDGRPLAPFVIAANAPAGLQSHTYGDIPAGSRCTVTEQDDGTSSTVTVVVVGASTQATIPSGATATVNVTNTYSLIPGGLVVSKSIRGAAAGDQGPITIEVVCGGTRLADFVIPAGTRAGEVTASYTNIPAGSECTVTETAAGSTSAVSNVTVPAAQQVAIPAGTAAEVSLVDTYSYNPGSLTVTKTIAGPAAGQQGPITIRVTCDGAPLTPDFVIDAGAPAGDQSHTYTGIPGNAKCEVIETADGHQPTVTAAASGSGQVVTVPPGGDATATITDTYDTGSIIVNKTITGLAAGSQGAVTIQVVCGGTPLADFVIPAGAAAGTFKEYTGILAGTVCTVTETATGAVAGTVTVTTSGSPQTITVGANGSATATLLDDYDFVPGSLTIDKTITGSAVGLQGEVTIEVVCGGITLEPTLDIPAGAPAGTTSNTWAGIPGDTTCTIQETADGASAVVAVATVGSGADVVVEPGGQASATITNTYTEVPGALVVTKTITGPSAGAQGPITIGVVCDGSALPDFVIPAGAAAGTTNRVYAPLPAGTACVVTETVDGTTSTVEARTVGFRRDLTFLRSAESYSLTIPPAAVTEVSITNTYTPATGALLVTKTIAGAAAGQQGDIDLLVDCGSPSQIFSYRIPAGSTGNPSRTFDLLDATSSCTVTETIDGATAGVFVVAVGSGGQVVISPADLASLGLSNVYTAAVAPTVPTTAPAPVTTQPTPDTLPATGARLGTQWWWAILALASGAALVAWSRRTRRPS